MVKENYHFFPFISEISASASLKTIDLNGLDFLLLWPSALQCGATCSPALQSDGLSVKPY
jgi:hypothetical protein